MRFLIAFSVLFWFAHVLAVPSPLAIQASLLSERAPAPLPKSDTTLTHYNILEDRKHNCYGSKAISCVKIYAEIDWVCGQVANKSYKLGTPQKGTRRVFRVFNGGMVFWEVVPRDMYKELYLTFEDCQREFRYVQDKCAVGTPGSSKRVTYSGWTVHPSGLVMVQMFN